MDITKFGLSNFRVFKEHFDFDLSPIMVLTGPNNSGKSSVSKALLLLKENQDQINRDIHSTMKLNYIKGEHDLGNHKYTVNTFGENTIFSFTYFLDYKFYVEINNEGEFIYDYKITTGDNKLIISQGDTINIDVKNMIVYFKDRLTSAMTNQHLDRSNADSFNLGKFNSYFLSVSELKKLEEFIYHLEDFGMKINSICLDSSNPLNDSIDAEETLTDEENTARNTFYSSVFDDDSYSPDVFAWQENLIFLLYKMTSIKLTVDDILFLIPTSKPENPLYNSDFFLFSDVIYIHTIKEPFKRAYSNNDNSKFTSLLAKQISKNIGEFNSENPTTFHINTGARDNEDESIFSYNETYEPFIQKWLKEFGIGEKLDYGFDEEKDIYFIKVDNKSLPEYGLGFGLIIHFLIALNYQIKETSTNRMMIEKMMMSFDEMGRITKKSEDLILQFPATCIIEEPETGLHPAFQSKMAEMIVDAQKTFGINFIIETHSEYFIRMLQSLTATNVLNPGDAVIYYFNNPKNVPINEEQIKKITIDKNGSLSDHFGTGFIDEGTNLKFNLLRNINRQQN